MTGVDALFARALAFEAAGQPESALEQYRRILDVSPTHADAWHNHGLLLARLGRLAEAEESHRAYARAVPDSARARTNLADVLLAEGRYAEAVENLDWVLQKNPVEAPALVRRGVALACLRRFDDARASFSSALRSSPESTQAFLHRVAPGADPACMLSPENIYLSRAYAALEHCDWSGWDDYVAEMRKAARTPGIVLEPAVAFMATHLPLDGGERLAISRAIASRIEARAPVLPPPGPRRGGRIRIGVLSPDFREHLKAYAILPLFELLDRERFEIHAYSLSADDGSAIRKRVRHSADGFHELQALTDPDAALAIRGDDIDLLLDAAGYMTGGRSAIMAQRPARVQAALPGFSGSLGSMRVDYAIVDATVAGSQSDWSERPIFLPHAFFLYDFREPIEQRGVSRAAYGLPEDAFVYCAFHKAEKINPGTFALWMQILRRVPGAVLWFRALSVAASRNLRAQAAACGIDPARLVFTPFEPRSQPGYLSRHRLGDLMLDAPYHNAITTACDALAAGLPVLTMQGTAMAARAGESLARAAGMSELVAPDAQSYVESAVRLATNPAPLRAMRSRLEKRDAPLFNTARQVRDLEACFERMLQVSAHCRSRL